MATRSTKPASDTPSGDTFGTFTKGDRTVTATSRARAVALRYDGWVQDGTGTSSPPADPPATPES